MRLIYNITLASVAILLIAAKSMAQQSPDILGDGFSSQQFEMESDYSGRVVSTLVRRLPILESRRAVLYVHGYNDYFFQRELADRFHDSLYNFYAIDLRKYGRSLLPEQTPFEVRDLKEYFADIDSAVMNIRREGAEEVILMGHSTGGLIASYYCGDGERDIDALILNSPFLDMNLSWFLESIALPPLTLLSGWLPDLVLSTSSSTAYYESLTAGERGEWSYDRDLKMPLSPPITLSWIAAIYRAQCSVQRGYDIDIPTLVMHSDKSLIQDEWSPEYQCSDAVLDVKDIEMYGAKLSRNVTDVKIKDGLHDLILSRYDVREEAYRAIFVWLSECGF